MFSDLVFVRLRAAEKALRDGHLDEAYRLVSASDLKDHKRAVAVREGLAEKFLERAKAHFDGDRFREALLDLDKAEAGQSLLAKIAELRGHVKMVMNAMQQDAELHKRKLDEARRRIEQGSLVAGDRILQAIPAVGGEAEYLRNQVQQRVEDASNLLKLAEQLMKQGHFAGAAERIRKAKQRDAHNEATLSLENQLCAKVLGHVRESLLSGKVALAADELNGLGSLGADMPAKREMSDILALLHEAGSAVRAGRYADARASILKLLGAIPGAKWLQLVASRLEQIEQLQLALRASPIVDRVRVVNHELGPMRNDRPLDETMAIPSRAAAGSSQPNRLLLLVDGGGSFLIVRSPNASIGRAAADAPADVPLFSDLTERHAAITRVDEDYFLFSDKEIEVGGKRTQRHLLRDGDRVTLGRKAKLDFLVPSRQSTTAVLDLSDTTKMPHDVRRVVLFHRHAMIGAGTSAHLRCRNVSSPLLLFERNGELWVRPKGDGRVDTEARPLRLGAPLEIGGVGLVLSPWKTSASSAAMA